MISKNPNFVSSATKIMAFAAGYAVLEGDCVLLVVGMLSSLRGVTGGIRWDDASQYVV